MRQISERFEMRKITVSKVRAHLENVIEAVEAGENIALVKHTGVVAKLTPVSGPGTETSSSEFRGKMGDCLAAVGMGETLLITKHKKPAMLLTPFVDGDELGDWYVAPPSE